MNKILGNKLSMSHGLGQKAMKVASKVGKVAWWSRSGWCCYSCCKERLLRDENVRQVGRMLAPGVAGLVHNAMR